AARAAGIEAAVGGGRVLAQRCTQVARGRQSSDQIAPTERAQGVALLRLFERVPCGGTRWFSLEHARRVAGQRSITGKAAIYLPLGCGVGLDRRARVRRAR